ncbi:tyrosine-type recombinase/integrase [Shouchella patagoniensis]|uniref:tyrosine-type recombinase/integrase n=1 Tax=Shouchella patagoniensis TaxID=228576 RepID=UPI000994EBE4|nr:tyrosine-type recombinase/integrase [Shouchella patagoniensis]
MKAGASKVEPIRSLQHIKLIKESLTGRDRLLFVLGINVALRISDLICLRIRDLRGKYAYITESKTGKTRRIMLNQSVRDEITKLNGRPDEEYLFPSRKKSGDGTEKHISRQQAYNIINGAVKRLGLLDEIGKVGTHTLRKTQCYHAYKNGTDLAFLQSMLGHSSQAVTLAYIGITDDNIDAIYESTPL